MMLYEPNDFALETNDQNDMILIRAKDAWEITKGNSSIYVGVNDTYLDVDHEDLEDDIDQVLANGAEHYHGTPVTFCAAGVTDNSIGLSSIGFDTNIKFKSYMSISNLLALANAGADIVNASYCYCTFNGYDADAIDEIHDMGVIITAGAGNGINGTHCGDGNGYCYPASYNHVISVSSVAHLHEYGYIDPVYGAAFWADCHEDSIDLPESCHTHNDSVDLVAPGYAVRTAKINDSYGAAWGTSFAAPIVAGACALVLSENPSLTPDEVEEILKSTAFDVTTIPENEDYEGLLGAGRINAYAAVNAARETNVTYASLPYSTGFESGLDENWTMYESHRYGRCVRSSDHSPHSGSYHITMDVIENNHYNTNEAWLHLNLSGKSNVELEFWWKDTGDESHATDGVYISDDGGDNFTKIYNLTGGSSTYSKVTIDLSDEISNASLSHSSTFIIKFQQYDNYTMTTDGIAIDDINVCAPLSPPSTIYTYPPPHCVGDWETYSCSVVSGAVEYDWEIPAGHMVPDIDEDGTRFVEVRGWMEGYYTLKVRVLNVCGQYSDWKSTLIHIEDCDRGASLGDDTFILHPNPANDIVTVSLNKEQAGKFEDAFQGFEVSVYDQLGNLLISEKTEGVSIEINIGHLNNGTYIFRILYHGEIYSYELVVQH